MSSNVQLSKKDTILDTIVRILEDMTLDWDHGYSGKISGQTRLMTDLAFESIDVVMLIVAIEEKFQRKGLPFESLLMVDGRYVEDLTVSQIVDFLQRTLT
jgi:acyl carrier protein